MVTKRSVVLHQFEFSHFNEKVRWALDFKGIEHERVSYLPGPHMSAIKKLSGNLSQTPVIEIDGEVVQGSDHIIERLESVFPSPALFPKKADQRNRAVAYQRRLDEALGPAARTVLFSRLINEGDYLCAMFARNASTLKRFLYRATFPLARGMIAKGNGTADPENIKRSFVLVEKALDELAQDVGATGYLVGEQFCVADLTAASLLAPLANPQHVDMARPKPVPDSIAELIAGYADHPAIRWAGKMYAEHRS